MFGMQRLEPEKFWRDLSLHSNIYNSEIGQDQVSED